MGAGRPLLTLKKAIELKEWGDNWDQEVIELYSVGASDVEIKALLKVSNDLWDRYMVDEDRFSETIKKGRALSAAWWEKKGRENLENQKFSYTGWYMNMKNRFRWTDRTDHTTDGQALGKEIKLNIEGGDSPDKSK